MLVLSRKVNERLLIGDDIEVVIVSIQGDKVQLGIEAPKGVRVDREEIAVARRAVRDGMIDRVSEAMDYQENQKRRV